MRRFAITLALLLVFAPMAANAQPMTAAQQRLYESLRRELIDKLQATGKFSSIAPTDPKTLKAKTLAGGEFAIALNNIAGDITRTPAQRPEAIDRFVRMVLATVAAGAKSDTPQTKEAFVATLRVVIRHSDYANHTARHGDPTKAHQPPIARPFAGDAVAIVAIDGGESLTLALAGAGAKHGLSDDELFTLGREQLRKYFDDMTVETAGSIRVFFARDESYSPSLLLLDEIWAKLEREFGAGFLVAIPDRTMLIAAPLRHKADIARARDNVARSRKSTPHIPHLIQRTATGWQKVE